MNEERKFNYIRACKHSGSEVKKFICIKSINWTKYIVDQYLIYGELEKANSM